MKVKINTFNKKHIEINIPSDDVIAEVLYLFVSRRYGWKEDEIVIYCKNQPLRSDDAIVLFIFILIFIFIIVSIRSLMKLTMFHLRIQELKS